MMFYMYTGIPALIAYAMTKRRETAMKTFAITSAAVMMRYNYIHPFKQLGANPLKVGGSLALV